MRPMPEQPQLIYLEPDDEITSVVRRLRAAEGSSVVIVAPGRSRATSSSVALRLLAQVAAEEKRSLALVADPATRAVASEAGIAAYASVAEATSGKVALQGSRVATRAPIHVVRGLAEIAPAGAALGAPADRSGPGDETVVVRTPKRAVPGGPPRSARGRFRLPKWPWLAGLLAVLLVVGAALLPGATVRITPATIAVPPRPYLLNLPIAGHQPSVLQATAPGTATGQRLEEIPATGTVTFFNRSIGSVQIPQGTQVSDGGTIAFTTTETITVPGGAFFGDPGEKSVGVVAVVAGTSGNVDAGVIDTIDNPDIRFNRRVANADPTVGGAEIPHIVVQQLDVDPVVAAIEADLASQLADSLAGQTDRVYAGPQAGEAPVIVVPSDLVGTEEMPTFELDGTLAADRPYVARADVQAAATEALQADPSAAPSGTSIVADSVEVEIGAATATADAMTVQVMVRAAAAAAIDESAVGDRVAGLTIVEAQAELADIGAVQVDLWPRWLDRLPRIPFRIIVETSVASPDASASP